MGRKQPHQSYRGYRNAGIRLSEEPLPHLYSGRSERIPEMLWSVHEFDKAHLVMLVEEKLIPVADGRAMLAALRQMEADGVEKSRMEAQGALHSGEQYLIRKLTEEVGGRMHLGRSSGDLDEVGRRMAIRKALLSLAPYINKFRATLLRCAEAHDATVMPGYTHGQNGQVTTYGHWLSMWACVLGRDFDRLKEAYARVNQCPAGAAIMTGTDFPINRQRTAELLGFDGSIPHTMDAIFSHDTEMEIATFLAILASDLGRMADDLMLWSSAEFRMIDVPDRFCGTSSIMMQKKNPIAPQEMKSLAASTVGSAMMAFMVEKGASGLPIFERRATERSFWTHFPATEIRLRDIDELVGALIVDADRMKDLAGRFWAQGTDLGGALVREKGLPWRTAHQIIGILVRLSIERKIAPLDVTTALVDEAAVEYMDAPVGLSEAALRSALDPTACVDRRALFGGPAPEAARRERQGFLAKLAQDDAWLEQRKAAVARGARLLESAIDAQLAPQAKAG